MGDEIENTIDRTNINDGQFTKEKYQKAKQSISEGKAGGEDTIASEV